MYFSTKAGEKYKEQNTTERTGNACFTQDPHALGTFGTSIFCKYVVDAGCIRGGSFCVKGSRYALGMHTAQIAKIFNFPSGMTRYTTHPLCTSGTQ